MEPTIGQTLVNLTVVVEQVNFNGKKIYGTRCYMDGWGDAGAGITPNDAVADVLKRVAEAISDKQVEIAAPVNTNCTIEKVDVSCARVEAGEDT